MVDRCYCIFEGGGAKGIAHVGVLRALARADLELVGFAGTSAGAIVAALAAAGYSADEMFGQRDSILDDLDLDPTNSSAQRVNRPIATPRRLLGAGWFGMQLAVKSPWILMVLFALVLIMPWAAHLLGASTKLAVGSAFVPALLAALWLFWMSYGLASVRRVRDAINQALALKLKGQRQSAPITFAEFERLGGRPLRIVAANISTGKLVLFSALATSHVAVADAVAASICIPIVFNPWKIDGDWHFDGGLVSNLPAWTFDVERARDRDAWTAAIEISDAVHKRPSVFGVLRAAALTALFGSSMLNTRSVARLKALRLKVDLKLLQFNFDRSKAQTVIDDADKQCQRRLIANLVDIPAAMVEVCDEICGVSQTFIDAALEEVGKASFTGRLRVGLFRPPLDDPATLVNEFSRGFEDHADERLRLPRESSLPGRTLDADEALYAAYGEWLDGLSEPVDRWTRKSISPDIHWCLCVPYRRDALELVAWIDSDQRLDLEEDVIVATMGKLADEISTILSEGVPREPGDDD